MIWSRIRVRSSLPVLIPRPRQVLSPSMTRAPDSCLSSQRVTVCPRRRRLASTPRHCRDSLSWISKITIAVHCRKMAQWDASYTIGSISFESRTKPPLAVLTMLHTPPSTFPLSQTNSNHNGCVKNKGPVGGEPLASDSEPDKYRADCVYTKPCDVRGPVQGLRRMPKDPRCLVCPGAGLVAASQ